MAHLGLVLVRLVHSLLRVHKSWEEFSQECLDPRAQVT